MSAPVRPTRPYISLDDPRTQNFFTKDRVQKHLRRAGLLNKNGEILTQAEYDSQQKDVAIGRENRRKIDDVIVQLINDLAKDHWAYARDDMEKMRKQILHEFRRMEECYRRRIHPISIQYIRNREGESKSADPKINIQSNMTRRLSESSDSNLPHISPAKSSRRPQSSGRSNIRRSTELDNVRQELNELKKKLEYFEQNWNTNYRMHESDDYLRQINQLITNFEEKQNNMQKQQKIMNEKYEEEKQRTDELYRQFKPFNDQIKSSEINNQLKENLVQISTPIKELRDRILKLEISFRNLPNGLTKEAIDQAIEISEKTILMREDVIKYSVQNLDDKIKQMEFQYKQLLTKLEESPNPINHKDVIQLIQNEIKTLKPTQPDKNEQQNSSLTVNNKINHLENQLNQLSKSFQDYIARPSVEELINQTQLPQKSIPPTDTNFEQRLNNFEYRLNTIAVPPNLDHIEQRLIQLENHLHNINNPHTTTPSQDQTRKSTQHTQSSQEQSTEQNVKTISLQQASQPLDDIEQKTQQQLESFFNTITELLKTKPDHQTVKELLQKSEAHNNQQINTLQQFVNKNQRTLEKIQDYLNNLPHRLDQQQPTIKSPLPSPLGNDLKSKEDSFTNTSATKELQAIMPFIELLPTFDMFYENEWN